MIRYSETVYIRRKKDSSTNRGDDPNTHKWKIGSSLKGQKPLSAFSRKEEEKFLPTVLGVTPADTKWLDSVRAYWANISKEVPPDPGLELEVGLVYENRADADKKVDADGVPLGTPINLEDYIIYRYCLVWHRVANDIKDISKSNKIWFYIYSKEKQLNQEVENLKFRKKAYALYLEIAEDVDMQNSILRLSKNLDDKEQKTYYNPDLMDSRVKDVALERLAKEKPAHFFKIAQDKSLKVKAFIERAIANGNLVRLPNTETIMYGDNVTIGYNMDEAVAFLNSQSNIKIRTTLEAQLNLQNKGSQIPPTKEEELLTQEQEVEVVDKTPPVKEDVVEEEMQKEVVKTTTKPSAPAKASA